MSKDDLWDALKEYPDAKKVLIEAGRKMLMKDNLLDLELAQKQDMTQETLQEKVERLECALDNMQTRFARLTADYNSVQLKLKQRLTKLETSRFGQKTSDVLSVHSVEDRDEEMVTDKNEDKDDSSQSQTTIKKSSKEEDNTLNNNEDT